MVQKKQKSGACTKCSTTFITFVFLFQLALQLYVEAATSLIWMRKFHQHPSPLKMMHLIFGSKSEIALLPSD
jgi:hypothetical protein